MRLIASRKRSLNQSRIPFLFVVVSLVVFALLDVLEVLRFESAQAASKPRPSAAPPSSPDAGASAALPGKKGVQWAPVADSWIGLPDGSSFAFGEAYQARVSSKLLNSQQVFWVEPQNTPPSSSSMRSERFPQADSWVWKGSLLPSLLVDVRLRELTFDWGEKGSAVSYGFDPRTETPWNPSSGVPLKNEFSPLPDDGSGLGMNSPWGQTFARKGTPPFDSQSGLDLASGLGLELFTASLQLNYAHYRARLVLELRTLPAPFLLSEEGVQLKQVPFHQIEVEGSGFAVGFYARYAAYSAGLELARKDAMQQAVDAAMDASSEVLLRAVREAPYYARVDAVVEGGGNDGTPLVLLGTGPFSDIPPGTRYQGLGDQRGVLLEVLESSGSGSVAQLLEGQISEIQVGGLFQDWVSAQAAGVQGEPTPEARRLMETFADKDLQIPIQVDSISWSDHTLSPPDLAGAQLVWKEAASWIQQAADWLFLGYRLWRLSQYDQPKKERPDPDSSLRLPPLGSQVWQRQIGFAADGSVSLPPPKQGERTPPVVVAVLDTGVDYNHPALFSAIWQNPFPTSDAWGRQDTWGWDFISNDPRPYDDGYHGTQVSSVLLQVAPDVKILPVKVFSPYGITTSAALAAGFRYAVEQGADIILCAWATRLASQALKQGIQQAGQQGVPVVTAVGDQGVNLAWIPQYPAAWSAELDNLLVVTSVDFRDQVVQIQGKHPNFDSKLRWLQVAAPGENLWVAEPRGGWVLDTHTGLAAAVAAGVLARNRAALSAPQRANQSASDQIHQLLQEAQEVPQLQRRVKSGARVRVLR
jgi:hypothetical protein